MALLAVGDQVWLSLITAVVTVVGGILSVVSVYLAYLARRLEAGQKNAAVEVKEVKETLKSDKAEVKAQLQGIANTGEKTHTLVNSAMGAQLKLHAETARAKADITNDAGDRLVAELAEEMLLNHQAKQAVVDVRG